MTHHHHGLVLGNLRKLFGGHPLGSFRPLGILCGLGASKQIRSLTYILFSRTYYRVRRYFDALARVSCAIVLNGKSFQEG